MLESMILSYVVEHTAQPWVFNFSTSEENHLRNRLKQWRCQLSSIIESHHV